jgi:hypothetical protein
VGGCHRRKHRRKQAVHHVRCVSSVMCACDEDWVDR